MVFVEEKWHLVKTNLLARHRQQLISYRARSLGHDKNLVFKRPTHTIYARYELLLVSIWN